MKPINKEDLVNKLGFKQVSEKLYELNISETDHFSYGDVYSVKTTDLFDTLTIVFEDNHKHLNTIFIKENFDSVENNLLFLCMVDDIDELAKVINRFIF